MTKQVHLSLLGSFVCLIGETPVQLATRKHRGLLTYLAAHRDRRFAREHLGALLWGDRAELQARRSLAQALYDIRSGLGDAAESLFEADGLISIGGPRFKTDLDDFRSLAKRTDGASLEAAMNLYGGQFARGLEVGEPPFDDWLQALRAEVQADAISALSRLAEAALGDGNHDRALQVARQGLELDHLSEPLCRVLLMALTRSDRRSEAIRQYQQFRSRMKSELGVEPSAETRMIGLGAASPPNRVQQVARAAATGANESAAPARPLGPVVAVMPFALHHPEPALGYLANGMADEMLSELGRFHCLTVLSRDSTFAMASPTEPNFETLSAFGASHCLRGSVSPRDGAFSLSAQLIEIATRRLIWSDRFNVSRADVFAAQDEVVSRVVTTVFGRLMDDRTSGARVRPTESLDAYDCVLRGMALLKGSGGVGAHKEAIAAREWFDRALEIDPNYARAHTWRACAIAYIWGRHPTESHLELNLRSVETALSIDPSDNEAHRIKGALHTLRREFELATHHLNAARAQNPNDAHSLIKGAFYQSLIGELGQATEDARRAMRLNPLHADWYWRDLGIVLFAHGGSSESLKALEFQSTPTELDFVYQTACLIELGRIKEARGRVEQLKRNVADMSLATIAASRPYRCYRDPDVATRITDGLAAAGLR